MQVTNEARDILKQVFHARGLSSIRVYFEGFGWSQPQIGLALDEPEADDKIVIINEICIAIEPRIEPYTQELTLDIHNGGLALLGNEDHCC